jgi:hypothetical protein
LRCRGLLPPPIFGAIALPVSRAAAFLAAASLAAASLAAASLAAALLAATFVVPAASAAAVPASITISPRIGIGAVRLGEAGSAVQSALGRPRIVTSGLYPGYDSYRSGAITVLVAYDGRGRVDAIDTESSAAVIYGHALGQGLAALKPVLVAHGWQVLGCRGATFLHLGTGGAVTGIAWRGTRLVYAQVDASGGVGNACPPTV